MMINDKTLEAVAILVPASRVLFSDKMYGLTYELYFFFLMEVVIYTLQQNQKQIEVCCHIDRKIVFEIRGGCQYKYDEPVGDESAGHEKGIPASPE